MKFCNCGSILVPYFTTTNSLLICSKCNKSHPVETGDTLINLPPEKPRGRAKYEYIIDKMKYVKILPIIQKKCKKCEHGYSRYFVTDGEGTWYVCINDSCDSLPYQE